VFFFLSGTALILDIVFAIRNNYTGNRTTLHLTGILHFRGCPFDIDSRELL